MLEAGFYNMDCMDGMKEFPDKYFDLAIVAPPYGDASQNRGGVLEQIRRTVRKVPHDTHSGRMSGSQTEHGVTRTGGGWAARYDQTKKLSRGTLPRNRNISMNCFASHETR